MKKNIKRILIAAVLISCISSAYGKCAGEELNKRYKTITVKPGDSVWTIANQYKGNKKVTNVVAEIQFKNNIKEIIEPGQELVVPVPGSKSR